MGAESLSADAVDALVQYVRAVVARQNADPGDDFFVWTREYGNHGNVQLVVPPGAPRTWDLDAIRVGAEDGPRYHVVVDMWTREEGRSDLSLEVDVWRDDDRWLAVARDLHVR